MLGLAHGAKGIFYELYYSYRTSAPYFVEALVDTMVADSFARGSNWYKVQEIASRLNGALGETLMTLDYDASGEDNGFLRLYPYSTVGDMDDKTTGTSESSRYLELYVVVGEQTPVNFHAGFFKKQVDNNYFLLTNVVTTMSKFAGIKVFPSAECSGYTNYRFRNIEPEYDFDSTFTDSMTIEMEFPAGEGYLFQVAPVIKYGGRLLYDELTGDGITLTDDMIIDNGAELSVYEDYYAEGNIIIKNGSIINQEGGKIHFRNGKKLIIEGNASIHGTSQDKLTFDFITPGDSNGIVIKSGGSLNMSYCVIKNAGTDPDRVFPL